MSENLTGQEVREQASNDGLLNTEPAVARGAVISAVGLIATILVVMGVLDEDQKKVLEENAGAIALAIITIIPIVQAIWTRASVYSPRTTAKVAVTNATSASTVPTLAPPP